MAFTRSLLGEGAKKVTGHLSAQVIWSEETEKEETKRAGALSTPLCGPTHSLKVFNLFLTAWFLGLLPLLFCKEAKKGAGAPLPHPISSLLVQFWR